MSGGPVATFAKGAGFNLLGRVVGQGFQMVAHVAVARLYGPAAFGLFGLGWTIFRLGSFLAPLGLETGAVRYGSHSLSASPGAVWETAKRATGLALLSSIVFGVALYLSATTLAALFNEPHLESIIKIFAIGFPVAAVMRVGVAVTRISQQMSFAVRSEYLLQPASFLLFVLILHAWWSNVEGAAWAAVGSYAAAGVMSWYYSRQLFRPRFTSTHAPIVGRLELLSFSVPVALAGVSGMAVIWVDRIILAYFMTARDLGFYQAASQLALLFTVITTATSAVMAPLVSDLLSRERGGALNDIYRSSIRWSLYLTMPAFLVVFHAPSAALAALFGSGYTAGSSALVVLTIGQLVSVVTGASGFMLVMAGHQKRWLWISGCAFGLNLALNLLLIPRFGLLGAASATSLTLAVMYVPTVFILRTLLGLWPYSGGIYRILFPSVITIFSLLAVNATFELEAIPTLALNAVVSVFVFAVSVMALGIPLEDKAFFRLLLSRTATKPSGAGTPG